MTSDFVVLFTVLCGCMHDWTSCSFHRYLIDHMATPGIFLFFVSHVVLIYTLFAWLRLFVLCWQFPFKVTVCHGSGEGLKFALCIVDQEKRFYYCFLNKFLWCSALKKADSFHLKSPSTKSSIMAFLTGCLMFLTNFVCLCLFKRKPVAVLKLNQTE